MPFFQVFLKYSANLAYLLLFSLLFVGFSGCNKKDVHKDYPEFQGLWTGHSGNQIYFLFIEEDNSGGSYFEEQGQEIVYGNATINEDKNILQIGTKKLNIQNYPYVENTNGNETWYCVLDQIAFTKS